MYSQFLDCVLACLKVSTSLVTTLLCITGNEQTALTHK